MDILKVKNLRKTYHTKNNEILAKICRLSEVCHRNKCNFGKYSSASTPAPFPVPGHWLTEAR